METHVFKELPVESNSVDSESIEVNKMEPKKKTRQSVLKAFDPLYDSPLKHATEIEIEEDGNIPSLSENQPCDISQHNKDNFTPSKTSRENELICGILVNIPQEIPEDTNRRSATPNNLNNINNLKIEVSSPQSVEAEIPSLSKNQPCDISQHNKDNCTPSKPSRENELICGILVNIPQEIPEDTNRRSATPNTLNNINNLKIEVSSPQSVEAEIPSLSKNQPCDISQYNKDNCTPSKTSRENEPFCGILVKIPQEIPEDTNRCSATPNNLNINNLKIEVSSPQSVEAEIQAAQYNKIKNEKISIQHSKKIDVTDAVTQCDELTVSSKDEPHIQEFMEIVNEYEIFINDEMAANTAIKEENATLRNHLSTLEVAFANLHERYEKLKSDFIKLHNNEDVLKKEYLNVTDLYSEVINKKDTQIKVLDIKLRGMEKSLLDKKAECENLERLLNDFTSK